MTRIPAALTLAFALALLAQGPALANRSTALRQRGQAELAAGRTERAVKAFEAAVVANPRDVAAYADLGRAQEAAGRPAKAAKYYAIALSIDPIDRRALEADGLLALKDGRAEAARERLERLRLVCAACAETTRLAAALALAGPPDPAPKP